MTDRKQHREELARSYFSAPQPFQPDSGFAARVLARIDAQQISAFQWAVRRALPITAALATLLAALLIATPRPGSSAGGSASIGNETAPRSEQQSASQSSADESDPLTWLLGR